jgi:PIN domain nuclease of toxin-antitoxin system
MRSALIDTHVFIWLAEDYPILPVSLRDSLENTDNVFVSIASFWEISINVKIGKLSLCSEITITQKDWD